MDPSSELINYMPSVGDASLADCATTHTILRDRKYFSTFTLAESNVHTISGPVDLILSALAQLQAGLTGLNSSNWVEGAPQYKALDSAVRERCGKLQASQHPPPPHRDLHGPPNTGIPISQSDIVRFGPTSGRPHGFKTHQTG